MPPLFLRHPLARDLAIVLAIKITAIVLAAVFLFGPSQRPHVDNASVAGHFFAHNLHQP